MTTNMSKANNRKDIKLKEELQAQFQLGIGAANETVLSWLRPSVSKAASSDQVLESTTSTNADQFLNLPVIPIGQGLSFDSGDTQDSADIHTIGDFINGNKKVSTLSKKKRSNTLNDKLNRINDRHRIRKTDSKATIALKNKMRNSNRTQVREKLNSSPAPTRPGLNSAEINNNSDDDDDEEQTIQRSVKKGSNLLFDSRGKKK